MLETIRVRARVLVLGFAVVAFGCGEKASTPTTSPAPGGAPTPGDTGHSAEVQKERGKLSPEDRALVDAQEWCVISQEERLGSMGAPIKLMIKDQPVFICCKGCKKKAESDPDKTLATVAELKAKAQAGRAKPGPN